MYKWLTALLILLMSVSAFSHGGHKVRDRYTDEHGVPYGGQNPPVGARNTNAHCMYSAYGCSGAGGSTGPRGYAYGHGSNPYRYQPYGAGRAGYGYGYGCGSYSNSGAAVGVRNGHTSGSLYTNRSQTNCSPQGYRSQSSGVSAGVHNGQASGSIYFNRSQTN